MKITIPDGDIEIDTTGDGGAISSDLKEVCPNCDTTDCYFNCEQSSSDATLESNEEMLERFMFNARVDGIESILLAMVCQENLPEDMSAIIQTAVDACGNNMSVPDNLLNALSSLNTE